jgi:two-component system chemotaxis sensor kinase CheA
MLSDDAILGQVRDAFYAEQAEQRQAASELLLELERGVTPARRRNLLNELFRQAHSMKGGARAANLPGIEQLAHAIEDLFSAAREGALELTPEICDPIYAALDAIGALASQSAAQQPVDLAPHQPLLEQLAAAGEQGRNPATGGDGHHRRSVPPEAAGAVPPLEEGPGIAAYGREAADATVRLSTAVLDGLLNETGELVTCVVRARTRAHEARALADIPARWRRLWRQAAPILSRSRQLAPAADPTIHYLDPAHRLEARYTAAPQTSAGHDLVRLAAILEQANTLIGEVERQIGLQARQLAEDHDQLADVAGRLHDQLWHTRLLPVATLQPALRLQLREMARSLDKPVELVFDDSGAAADRQVLEQLREVLQHLLRNALDHGIEAPAARAACGKPAEATIRLSVAVRGEQLVLLFEDDGAGLDVEAIRQRALSSGILSPADAEQADAVGLSDLIFRPGFTTRPQAGVLSGRGVGLDVVRTQMERIGGEVSVRSEPGRGCAFTLVAPLSLASSIGLWLKAGASTFVIPLEHVRQILAIAPRDVQLLEGRPVCLVLGRPLALVPLAALLDVPGASGAPASPSGGTRFGLVLGIGERQIVLQVDAVLGERPLVVQRLPAPLVRVRFLAGATILEDGEVVPILDAVDLLRYALGSPPAAAPGHLPAERPRRTILVVDDSITTRTLETNILQAAGYNVALATDGYEALTTLARLMDDGGCDLLLSDVDMPRLDGYELTSRVRADVRLRHLPIVLVTSLGTPEQHARGVAAGADAYIVKRSFDQQALLATIERLIGQE